MLVKKEKNSFEESSQSFEAVFIQFQTRTSSLNVCMSKGIKATSINDVFMMLFLVFWITLLKLMLGKNENGW